MQETTEAIQAVKAELLTRVTYRDSEIQLECYADMITSIPCAGKGFDGTLAAIRFGGYPEQVRALCEAISGGGTVEVFDGKTARKLKTLEKQYTRQFTNGEIYSEAAMFLRDEAEQLPDGPAEEGEEVKQASLDMPPRKAYLFCPPGDNRRLFAEIDKRTRVPLIPEFQDYVLEALKQQGSLKKLSVVSPLEPFDAWELSFSQNESNVIRIVESGLKQGQIQIPGATAESAKAFKSIETVSQYLQAFGKETAERIKEQFVPLFDPEKEPLSEEVQYLNRYIESKAGYELYPAQLR